MDIRKLSTIIWSIGQTILNFDPSRHNIIWQSSFQCSGLELNTLTNTKTDKAALWLRGGNITISDYLERRTLFLSFSIRTSAYSFTSEREWTKRLEYFFLLIEWQTMQFNWKYLQTLWPKNLSFPLHINRTRKWGQIGPSVISFQRVWIEKLVCCQPSRSYWGSREVCAPSLAQLILLIPLALLIAIY